MPIKLDAESHGKQFTIHVSGKLTKEDYAEFVPAFERLMVQHGKLRLLLNMAGFLGCEVSAAWEEFKLGVEHYVDIERIAMVGEKQWQHNMATFCKPFTRATVRYSGNR